MLKKVLALLMMLTMMLCSFSTALAVPSVSGEAAVPAQTLEQCKKVGYDFVLAYNKASETLKYPDFSEYVVVNDDTSLFLEQARFEIAYREAFNDPYKDVAISDFAVVDSGTADGLFRVNFYARIDFNYSDAAPGFLNHYGMNYEMWFEPESDALKIVKIDTDSGDYSYAKRLISEEQSVSRSSVRSAAIAATDKRIRNLANDVAACKAIQAKAEPAEKRSNGIDYAKKEYIPYEQMKAITASLPELEEKGTVTTSDFSPQATVSFDAEKCRYYGWWFGDWEQNYIFKRMDADCTNFASQCIWAGYGGQNGNSLSTEAGREACRVLVSQNYRQTSTWFGRNYTSPYDLATGPFMRVIELWDYATTNTGNGPRATGYNNNKKWDQLTATISKGDVLQFHDGSKYSHSVVVSSSTSYTLPDALDNIYVAQHSGDYYYRKLRDVLVNNGGIDEGKMRLMKFKSTTY